MIYSNIHILKHQGGGIAPWNLTQYSFVRQGDNIIGNVRRTRSLFEVIFFHFQYVKFLPDGIIDIGWYYISSSVKKMFYLPYLKEIQRIEGNIKSLNNKYKTGYTVYKSDSFRDWLKILTKKVFGYNIITLK